MAQCPVMTACNTWHWNVLYLQIFITPLHQSLRYKTQHREGVSFGNKEYYTKMRTIQPFPKTQMKTNPKTEQLGNNWQAVKIKEN